MPEGPVVHVTQGVIETLSCIKVRRHLIWLALYLVAFIPFAVRVEPSARTMLYFLL